MGHIPTIGLLQCPHSPRPPINQRGREAVQPWRVVGTPGTVWLPSTAAGSQARGSSAVFPGISSCLLTEASLESPSGSSLGGVAGVGIGVQIPTRPLAGPGAFRATSQASLQPEEHRMTCTENPELCSQQLTDSSVTSPPLSRVPSFHIRGD